MISLVSIISVISHLPPPKDIRPAYTMQDFLHSRYGDDPQRRLEHVAASCGARSCVQNGAYTLQTWAGPFTGCDELRSCDLNHKN